MSRQGQRSPVETRESAITATDRDNAGEFKTCTQPPSMSIRRPSTNESDDEEEEQLEDYLHPHSKQGFLRPRQRSNGSSSSSSSDMPPRSYSLGSENIRKFSQESLYSYSFTPSLPRSNRMRIMRHGMDFVRRIRCKLDDRVTRRYSHPDIGASTFDWQMNTWSTVNTPRTSIDYDSMVTNGNGSDPTTMTTTTHPMDDIPSSSSSSKQQRKTSMTKRPSTDTSCNNAESCQSYRRILHTPTRFLPQNQAIFTTDHDGTILLFNDIASLCFVMDKSHVGQSLLTVLQQPFRDKTARLLRDRTAGDEDPVLVCGTVVPIIKTNGEKSAASLWLKRKERDGGKIVYIWIFEEILESTLTAYLDPKGTINQVIGKMQELYGYSNEQVIGKHISLLIPSLNADPSSTIDVAATMKFFGSQTKYGAFFPAMGTLHANNDHTAFTLKIISLPTVAGMITIHTNGMIQSMSAVPAKYLFGYPTVDSLVEKVPISQLLPQLPEILDNLQRDGLWGEDGNIIGNTTCRRALVPRDLATTTDHKLSISSNNNNNAPPLPVIYAVHHDGSQFEVQLRLRSITSAEGQLISVWVAFDRIQSLNRRNSTKRKASSPSTTQQQPHNDDNDNDNDDNDPQEHNPNMDDHPHCHGHGHGHEKKARSSFRSRRVVQMAKARAPLPNRSLAPVVELSEPNPESPTTTSPDLDVSSPPEQRPPPLPTDEHHPLDDYEILDTLGEGTYGAAKLAYRKDDEAQKMVVIKCIRKSRILVDSWMRDRRYGDIVPAEIHILRTLQQCPQQNCCSLLAHMEDQDFYYVVMALHGDGMDLFDYIELNEEICEQEVRAIFRQVAEAVRHLHHNKIVHRDIKDENIILDESGTVLLIDFGSAAYFRSGKKFETFCGTMEYWAPELLQGISYDGPPQDIWSLGILLHTLIFRETPFYQLDDILEDQLHIRDLPYPGPHDILHKMLNKDPSKRPTIDDVLADPWFVQ